jgi:hypothetical protein
MFTEIIQTVVLRWAALDPDRTALVWEKDEPGQEERMSYSQLLDLVGRLANLLRQVNKKCGSGTKFLLLKFFFNVVINSSEVQKFIRPKFLRNVKVSYFLSSLKVLSNDTGGGM